MSHDFHLPPTPPSVQKDRANAVWAICFIWVLASVLGFAVQAFAASPAGLRGSHTGSTPTPKSQARSISSQARSSARMPGAVPTPQAWLGNSVWRAGPCESAQNFQTFTYTPSLKVEVGSGKPGEGEKLDLVRIARVDNELIQIETRVCAPVGCNQTIERYKIIGPNQMQEWHFEGRLPDHVPYVIVANGAAVDGSGAGRTFNRCAV
jgi:hypothetical protein